MLKRFSTSKSNKGFSIVELMILLVVVVGTVLIGYKIYKDHKNTPNNTSLSTITSNSSGSFNYGFDFNDQGPDPASFDRLDAANVASSVATAKQTMSSLPGIMMDQSLYGFGADSNPEPAPGQYNLTALKTRIDLITSVGGTPVITLINAPSWMHPSSNVFSSPPDPQHYQDYANLCAYVAKSFPQVKYFTVWSEIRKFSHYDPTNAGAAQYTTMYNDIYKAIKAVRPDAKVGGPYASLSAESNPYPANTETTLHGSWGYVNPAMQNALNYWLKNKVGADYVAIDGATELAKSGGGTNPVNAAGLYGAVDSWIKSQTNLPIWWMESHIAPAVGWSEPQGAAARVATLIEMNASGAAVGMQWQGQEQYMSINGSQAWPDEGFWTTPQKVGGGQPTDLTLALIKTNAAIKQPLTVVTNEPSGVIVARTTGGIYIAVNTNGSSVSIAEGNTNLHLNPYSIQDN